ncbi:hypothetical protein JKP88DRAFT_242918 [Tribonema minus]|uniref:Uncharacterized protein n=1 Tax=Tribonema minus TaxID=303371 RepID=A0A835ZLF5_9STRA|nr:hypothetical protein JKP88DRAFT_242918 [Tribonema minus]
MQDMRDDEARKLHATTGVDFIALRQKYMTANVEAQQKEQDQNHSDSRCDTHKGSQQNRSESPLQQRHLCTETAALDKYVICKECSGLGIRKELYNHMVLERSCEHCDGDGIAPRK